jgi:hypothetical protein
VVCVCVWGEGGGVGGGGSVLAQPVIKVVGALVCVCVWEEGRLEGVGRGGGSVHEPSVL